VAALLTGAALYIAPAVMAQAWGWALTPLTARMIGDGCAHSRIGGDGGLGERPGAGPRADGRAAAVWRLQLLAMARFAGSVIGGSRRVAVCRVFGERGGGEWSGNGAKRGGTKKPVTGRNRNII
jgi:hypothetical protein